MWSAFNDNSIIYLKILRKFHVNLKNYVSINVSHLRKRSFYVEETKVLVIETNWSK